MIHLQGKLPRKIFLACSGGVDSMAALDFLRRNHEVTVLFVHHDTDHSEEAYHFLGKYCNERGIPIQYSICPDIKYKPKRMSREEWWRECRYNFIDQGDPSCNTVVTCHHLDDVVETWIWSSLNGQGKIIPYRRAPNSTVIRPFRLTRKRDFQYWASFNQVPYIEDDSNRDLRYTRNYIRHELMPHALRVNPGIHKTIAKKVKEDVE